MTLTIIETGHIAFDKAAIMRRACAEGRFALRMCRTIAERRQQLSHWLRKAWKLAKGEAAALRRRAEDEGASLRALIARAAEAVALVAAHGGAEGIRQAIEAEHYRQHFNGARIETLRAALSSIGA
jgi:hypothetical protein